ncbi:pectate lyase, PelA/Pel-15E family [Fibrobacter sp. UWB15]|uniref:pectate lyase n=1 Tax=unclassified Fibrobacter TaxID=2634177 RepID=UPI000915AD81|nr:MULTISPECIES: pectate lyase [unclassified Fibrobacter]PWJ66340.1 PelA/Pel-15E family pectate lyase [Fibrobacter sp. UWB6]SHG36665.1 pectate lyase, PelA/Pel-15E family [Fibrobacter sp. UWB8]SMG20257.1 pectate lyase, PelA/Pel-15E family [Fibrobacter sp. UWB15]
MSVWKLPAPVMGAFGLMFAVSSYAADYVPPSTAVSKVNSYRGYSELTSAASGMDIDQYTYNMTTWQIGNGGFYKAMADKYKSAYSGGQKSEWRAKDGGDLGTIDNNATIQEMRLLAVRYKETTNNSYKAAFKTSFNKALNFILTMQRSTGGLPQVWPKRGNYSDHVTLNDNAMVRAMVTMMDIANKTSPFDSDIIDDATRSKMKSALDKAIQYLLKAQIVNNGNLTVWCAQHDTANYAPRPARAYELESKSGSESAGVVWFLMNWPEQTEAIQKAVKGAIAWYKKTKVTGLYFNKKAGTFDKRDGNVLWYRFYEVNNDNYFFCDRDGASTKTQDFTKISEERRTGYQWAGDYGSALLSTEAAYLEALEKMSGTYVPPPPPAALCGSDTCKTYIDGVNFVDIKGAKEATNTGFVGEGYANVDNETGSYVTYGVTAAKAGEYDLTIRFANGGSGARGYDIYVGDVLVVQGVSMGSTGGWTTWEAQTIKVPLEKGYSELKFVSTSKDGMANIDYVGWMSADLYAGEKDIGGTTVIGDRAVQAVPANAAARYYVNFGSRDNAAGVYLKKANGKIFRVNGAR